MIKRWILLLALCFPFPGLAKESPIQFVLDDPARPGGVVFEIVAADDAYLNLALPQIEQMTAQLRERFPDLPVAVVTHGGEQFSLTHQEADEHEIAHASAQALVRNNVPIHVCGTHASWRKLGREDFPDYVDVAPSGPAQVRAYEALGYELILL